MLHTNCVTNGQFTFGPNGNRLYVFKDVSSALLLKGETH